MHPDGAHGVKAGIRQREQFHPLVATLGVDPPGVFGGVRSGPLHPAPGARGSRSVGWYCEGRSDRSAPRWSARYSATPANRWKHRGYGAHASAGASSLLDGQRRRYSPPRPAPRAGRRPAAPPRPPSDPRGTAAAGPRRVAGAASRGHAPGLPRSAAWKRSRRHRCCRDCARPDVDIHELRIGRKRWIVGLALQTTDPAEE